MADQVRTASGGVRNLRAMFENKQPEDEGSTSATPNRGRQGAPDGTPSTTNSPITRPLNKVQTNFVPVDRNSSGSPHWRLKNKDTSEHQTEKENSKSVDTIINNITNPPSEPEMPRRRDSFSFHDELPAEHRKIEERKRSIAEEFQHRQSVSHSLSAEDAIPEFAVETPALETPQVEAKRDNHQLGYMEAGIKAQDTDSTPHKYSANKETGQSLPKGTKTEDVITLEKAREGVPLTKAEGEKLKDAVSPMNLNGSPASNKGSPTFAAKPSPPPFARSTPPSAANMARGASYKSTPPTVAANAAARSTTDKIANPPGPPANAAPSRLTSTSARPSTSSATSSTANAAAKKSTPSASSGSGLAKARPKSPTRPARLPSSLTAPTASSIKKVAGAPANDVTTQRRRGSTTGSAPSVKASGDREPSRLARSDGLRHANSHTRPSVGPPPAKDAVKKTVSKVIPGSSTSVNAKPANDSFLERMMRPTAASQSKTHVKVEEQKDKVTKPKPVVPAASAPVQIKQVEKEKPQTRAQPTIELAGDPSSPTGNKFKKLPPGVVPIPKLAKRKSKPEPLKDSTIQEVKIEHRRVSSGPRSPRPPIVSNPTTIAEEEEPEEMVGINEDGNFGHVSVSEGSDSVAKDGQPQSTSEQAEAVPAGVDVEGKNDEAAGAKSDAPSSTSESKAVGVSSNLDVSENGDGSALDNGSNYVIRKPATQKSLDVAEGAVDDAVARKGVADQESKKADVKESDAVQHLAQVHQLNSSMLDGSALDTDDEETPEVEKADQMEVQGGDENLCAEADATKELAARGEADFEKDNVEDVEATALAS